MDAKPAIQARPATSSTSTKPKRVQPKTMKPRTVQPLTIEAVTVEAKTVKAKTVEVKPMQAKTIEAKPAASKPTKPNSRYEGSQVQQWDNALLAGGTWAEMAQSVGLTPGRLRAHAKYRTDVEKSYKLEENGDLIRLIRFPPAF